MFKICPKLPGKIFEEPPSEEEILSFIRELGHTDLVFQVEKKNSKKNNDMYYPRFTKVIVNYFMAKHPAILRRNKMFWHYARDEFIFTTTPKPKSIKKKADSKSSLKIKPTQASKRKRIKTSAKEDKPIKMKQSVTKSKGLTMLSKAALSEAGQMKLATERSKKEFHISHTSGSGDGVDILSKVLDEQQQTVSENVSGETKSEDDEDDFVYLNLSTYNANDLEEKDEREKANNNDEVSFDQKVSTPPDYEILDEEDNEKDDDKVMRGEQEDEKDEEVYKDLNLNLDRQDAEMTEAQINQETKEVYVTLTTELSVVQQQSSSVSSDLVSKFINPTSDTGKEESSKKETQKESKSISFSKGASRSQPQSSSKSSQLEDHGLRVDDLEEPFHQEFNTRNDDVSPVRKLAQAPGTISLFNEFLATPIDFSTFIMNQLKIHNLTQDVLIDPTYDLMKGTYKSVVELEYHLEKVLKATYDQLDWHNPEGRPDSTLNHVRTALNDIATGIQMEYQPKKNEANKTSKELGTWIAFGGNTRDLDTDKILTIHEIGYQKGIQTVETALQFLTTVSEGSSDGGKNFGDDVRSSRHKEALEDSAGRHRRN
uniref:Uncharacterized protein n=1 Tax=Tanacetum cinerariifolium TaxID=118510 RepID=A0A6L2KX93_TANCI|nr:hypothetical protein [Tanacetum cinerariifolium]